MTIETSSLSTYLSTSGACCFIRDFPGGSDGKASVYNARDLGSEDCLKKEMATHSSTLASKIPWTEELGAGYYPWGPKESGRMELVVLLICC